MQFNYFENKNLLEKDFKSYSDQMLLSQTKALVQDERKLNIQILHHLKEIEIRKLHLTMGYSSLFKYATAELGYSEDAAYRRISAMRLLKDIPQVEDKLAEGALSLSSASKIQSFFKAQNTHAHCKNQSLFGELKESQGDQHNLQTQEQKLDWIQSLENKSTREIEKEILKVAPKSIFTERVRSVTEDKIELRVILTEDLKKDLDQLRNLLSHTNPNMSYQELISYLAQMGLKKLDPSRKENIRQRSVSGAQKSSTEAGSRTSKEQRSDATPPGGVAGAKSKPAKNFPNDTTDAANRVKQKSTKLKPSRYIPAAIKREVYLRDQASCSYTNHQTSKRCSSKHLLQFDHIQPLSLNGQTTTNNLRLLCFNHHKLVTENVFGE